MKASRLKVELAMARACMTTHDIAKAATIPEPSVKNVLYGKKVRPKTLGKVALALGVDVSEIIENMEN